MEPGQFLSSFDSIFKKRKNSWHNPFLRLLQSGSNTSAFAKYVIIKLDGVWDEVQFCNVWLFHFGILAISDHANSASSAKCECALEFGNILYRYWGVLNAGEGWLSGKSAIKDLTYLIIGIGYCPWPQWLYWYWTSTLAFWWYWYWHSANQYCRPLECIQLFGTFMSRATDISHLSNSLSLFWAHHIKGVFFAANGMCWTETMAPFLQQRGNFNL